MEKTNAIGIITKKGRYGGTYAHRDIAFEFARDKLLHFCQIATKQNLRMQTSKQFASCTLSILRPVSAHMLLCSAT